MTATTETTFSLIRGQHRPDLIRTETLADILEATANTLTTQTALIFGEQTVSYQELNQRADYIAHELITKGVKAGDIVGLWLARGIDLLVAQAGITKAGAAWLPFDTDTPVERIAVCLADANAVGIISSREWQEQLVALSCPVWPAQQLMQHKEGVLHRRTGVLPSHPAYVIYTSGSTGKPKGIMINHGSICHFLRSENSVLGVNQHDKVYQGFSVAFDMSFEEIWISYLVGATLWLAPRHLVSDPDALPITLKEQQITVLHAVPTLLALFADDVPNLRIINLGGEACPESLVTRWALPHHQLFNTYGPTEATVSASLAQLQQGHAVTIGTPLPNYGLLVIDETFNLLPVGAMGELCIFGVGVAEGYVGRADLTAEKFCHNPWAEYPHEARLYRTGDLARLDEFGQIHCLGRTDDQVKIRGFRVELGEIEALLCTQESVGTAAVVLRQEDGIEQLIAFIVADNEANAMAMSLERATLRQALRAKLPPYMIPSHIEVLPHMPRLLSGKIDRHALRKQPLTATTEQAQADEPQNPEETVLFAILSQLFPNVPIQLKADFFDDLGGHSLLVARLISRLRAFPEYCHLTINDIYQRRRVGAIAARMQEENRKVPDATPPWQAAAMPTQTLRHHLCGLAQSIVLPLLIGLHILQWLAPFFVYHYLTGSPGDSLSVAIFAALCVFLFTQFMGFIGSIVGKRLLMSGIGAGRYPLWGVTYFRWWLADRLSDIAPTHLLSGSSLYSWYLRGMGAKVGSDVIIGSISVRMPTLLSIGDGVSIGSSVNLENARIERGWLVLGTIDLAEESYVGSYAILEENTRIEAYGRLQGLSALAHGQTIGERQIWDGSPAKAIGMFDPDSVTDRLPVSSARRVGELLLFITGIMMVSCLFFIPVFPTFIMVDWLDVNWISPLLIADGIVPTAIRYFILAIPASAVMVVLTVLLSVAIRWTVLPRLKAGVSSVHSKTYYRKWFANHIQESSLHVLHGIYATIYAPWWYRMLGAKIGKGTEISTAMGVVPDMLTLGDGCFVADAVMLGDEEISGGWMTLKPTVVGNRSFIGNGAYVPDGTKLPDGVLIGVQSKVDEDTPLQANETWFGSPPIRLPAREVMTGFTEALTFHPSVWRWLARGAIEALRIVLPLALTIGVGYMIVLHVFDLLDTKGWLAGFLMLVWSGLLYGMGCFVFIATLKWLLIGRYRLRAVPMWTLFVWLSEAVTSLYESIAVPNFLNHLRGTPLLPMMMRLLGVKIGRQVYLDTTYITEFDCVAIGDYSELNGFCGPQTHLFEDRIMKIGQVSIGSQVTISARSIILYNSEIGDDVWLGPLTLIMKGEQIPAGSAWTGSPATPWSPTIS